MLQKPYVKEILIHIAVWVCIALLPLTMSIMEFRRIPNEFMFRFLISPLLFYVNFLILVPKLLLKKKILLYVLCSIVFLYICNYLLIEILPNRAFENINSLIIEQQFASPFARGIKYGIPIIFSFSIFLLGGVFSLVINYYRREQFSNQLITHQKEMELSFLRSQLNPHFLFNSLNSIYALVRSKANDAPEAVITLSELMRYMLYEVSEEKVPLEKELNYIKNYIYLQRLRIKDSSNVKLHITGDTSKLCIHPLVLISFIENAFKYGTDYKGNTIIDIRIIIENSILNFEVNNIIGNHKADKNSSGIGLNNIKEQLNHLYKGNHQLYINEERGHFTIKLELKLNR